MDSQARRDMWALLMRCRAGRCIVLCTHYMDEADVLGDRVGILARGALKCVGSSLFLKRHYGGGYRLECERSPAASPSSLAAFDGLLRDAMGGRAARERTGAEARLAARQIIAILDARASTKLPELFEALDARLGDLEIESYGVGPSTLEQVFLKVGAQDDADDDDGGDDDGGGEARKRAAGAESLDWGDLRADDGAQLEALLRKQVTIVAHDVYEVANAALPFAAAVLAFALDRFGCFGSGDMQRDFCVAFVAAAGWVVYPAYCCARQGRKRVIQRRFNVGVLETISERKASTLWVRPER